VSYLILAPASTVIIPPQFTQVIHNPSRHDQLLADMQRFRGKVYLADGAIQASSLTDGRHAVDLDEHGWHLLSIDPEGKIYACLRYSEIFSVAQYLGIPDQFRKAVQVELKRAQHAHHCFGEVGGLAISEEHRASREFINLILASFGIIQVIGGCCGIATATVRHNSAGMLERIGLYRLTLDGVDLPVYLDDDYACEMVALRFDSLRPMPAYTGAVRRLRLEMEVTTVVTATPRQSARP
jgi:hypothetical protein